MTNLSDLIQELESANVGSRELDAKIATIKLPALATYEQDPVRGPGHWISSDGARWWAPSYTTSLDDALLTVPDGMLWRAGSLGAGVGNPGVKGRWWEFEHDEPALALCVAALKAREA